MNVIILPPLQLSPQESRLKLKKCWNLAKHTYADSDLTETAPFPTIKTIRIEEARIYLCSLNYLYLCFQNKVGR